MVKYLVKSGRAVKRTALARCTASREVFDVAETQSEAVVEPDGVADDGGRESVPGIADDVVGHPATLLAVPSS